MRFITLFFAFLLAFSHSADLCAAGKTSLKPQGQTVKDSFYIKQEPDMEYLYNFNSSNLKNSRRIRIFLPKSYASSENKYPVLYVLDGQFIIDEEKNNAFVEAVRAFDGKKPSSEYIIAAIDGNAADAAEYSIDEKTPFEKKPFVLFLTRELIPYIDSNYRTISEAQQRVIAGKNFAAPMALAITLAMPDSFKKAAVFSAVYKNGAKDIENIAAKYSKTNPVALWTDAPLYEGNTTNVSFVSSYAADAVDAATILQNAGLEFENNYITYFPSDPESGALTERIRYALAYLTQKNALKIASAKAKLSYDRLFVSSYTATSLLTLNLKYKNGFSADYIPSEIKAMPPYLYVNKGFLTFSRGAELGKSKASVSFNGYSDSFSVSLSDEKYAQQAVVTFNVSVPKGYEEKPIILISPYSDTITRLENTKDKKVKTASLKLPTLSNYAFTFVCLDGNKQETYKNGKIKETNLLRVEGDKVYNYKIEGFAK